jgi:heme A synthase
MSFVRYAWAVLAYNLLVIVWGAYVRASGSGAGCGSHWPLCNGSVLPRAPQIETMIELTHRVTSGLALILVIILVIRAFRNYPQRHRVRYASLASLFFILTEALIGAGLVLFEYVAQNTSIARAFWMSGHLINTFLLLAALSLTAWWAREGPAVQWDQRAIVILLAACALGMLVLGVSGAVAALGDTLFPSSSLAEGIRQDLTATSHILLRLRILHPLIAVAVGAFLIAVSFHTRSRTCLKTQREVRVLSTILIVMVVVQLVAGLVNLLLLAPIWMQLVHLLLSNLVWIALVLLGAASLASSASAAMNPNAGQYFPETMRRKYSSARARSPL